ncbi:MAG: FtsL-like putative cell division protein [Prevotella sp.]|uniref:FtsL-like putative cell division protein n=1 Tax=Prevotella sp. TaxID=59823 RepID=UPI002A2F65EB|nr:FtsL-like putative cell division protein [Prevotella sp.]MDD7318560.1 FtsL-like putative cell division protein [Prevotellaceae bacterium]MDY4020361.1 FtsL-like putative cell division protein [Prevotella sp.]
MKDEDIEKNILAEAEDTEIDADAVETETTGEDLHESEPPVVVDGNEDDAEETKEGEKTEKKEQEKKGENERKGKENDEEEMSPLALTMEKQAREDEKPLSKTLSLRKILGGDFFTAEFMRKNVGLIVLIVVFTLVYVANRYSCQSGLLEIDKLNKELQDSKYKALSSASELTEKCRETHVLEMLKHNRDSILKQADQPPYIINVEEK